MSLNEQNAYFVVFDNRSRHICWVGHGERALLSEQESTHDGNELHMVSRELRRAWRPDELYVDDEYIVRVIATGEIAEVVE